MPRSLRSMLAEINKTYSTTDELVYQAAPAMLAIGRFTDFKTSIPPGPVRAHFGLTNLKASPFTPTFNTTALSGTSNTGATAAYALAGDVPAYVWKIRGPQQSMMGANFQGKALVQQIGPGQATTVMSFNFSMTLQGGPVILYYFLAFSSPQMGIWLHPWDPAPWNIPSFGLKQADMIFGPLADDCFVDAGPAGFEEDDHRDHYEFFLDCIAHRDFGPHRYTHAQFKDTWA